MTQKVFVPERVHELVNSLIGKNCFEYAQTIAKWLEQNPVEIVVGLSDGQVEVLVEMLQMTPSSHYRERITNYLKIQTFAQPEAKAVVIGLNDEQATRMCKLLDIEHLEGELKEWLKSQSFSQQFVPNWDDVPATAKYVRVVLSYLREDFMSVSSDAVIAQFERPKPKVEVGQVWTQIKTGKHAYEILHLGRALVNDEWEKSIVYRSLTDGAVYTRTLPNFIAEFERVARKAIAKATGEDI